MYCGRSVRLDVYDLVPGSVLDFGGGEPVLGRLFIGGRGALITPGYPLGEDVLLYGFGVDLVPAPLTGRRGKRTWGHGGRCSLLDDGADTAPNTVPDQTNIFLYLRYYINL